LLLACLVVICAAAVIAVVLLSRPREAATDIIADGLTPIGNLVVDENNLTAIQKEIAEKVERGMFETHMNTTWTFPNGKSASTDAVLGNSVNNNYAFWCEVRLAGTNEVVYTSSLLPVGSQLAEIKLSKNLEKGEYSAVLSVYMVDENNEPVESNMGFGITLIVKK
jgi:hypothetical protein